MRAALNKNPDEVAAMFDDVAKRYDLINDLSSLGQDRWWRRATAKAIGAQPGQRVLDVAAGTGSSAEPLADAGVEVVCCDLSPGMLEEGRARRPDLEFVLGDATALPFEDASFDAVTISFGLRNVSDPALAIRDMARVVKPGGRLVVCEFSTPRAMWFRRLYHIYLTRVIPAVASLSSNPEAYTYLSESILAWPNQQELGVMIRDNGWARCEVRDLTGGIVALHRAFKAK